MIRAIRNFCIIAHIDHGKSTLADRLLEMTGTVPKREMREQMLDQMDLERERGITIKLAPVRMPYTRNGETFELNLIDTPGHVDFSYEVSRSLAAVEGAVLLVDATQGVQAQTVANLRLAREQGITIIPVINKIDASNADIAGSRQAVSELLDVESDSVLAISAKTGDGVRGVLDAIVDRIPPPAGQKDMALSALIFDSFFDDFRGVVAAVRVYDGSIQRSEKVRFVGSGVVTTVLEVGSFTPKLKASAALENGEIGYLVTGLKSVKECSVGETVTALERPTRRVRPGYSPPMPMVFAGLYPKGGDDFGKLRQAIERLQLNDASLTYQPERSDALGFGFRCGFLGLLHLDIVRERLTREYGLDVLVTVPSVAYRVVVNDAGLQALRRRTKAVVSPEIVIRSPLELPPVSQIERIEEPWMTVQIVGPSSIIGPLLTLVNGRRGMLTNTEYGRSGQVTVIAEIPLASLLRGFYDTLKGVSSGYASMSYDFLGYRPTDVERLDILIAEEPVEALSTMAYVDEITAVARQTVERLKELIPPQLFTVKLQAAVGGRIIAAERIAPKRKDVTAKLYGGDVTRKRKLLEKQKRGKQRLQAAGRVEIPPDVYSSLLRHVG